MQPSHADRNNYSFAPQTSPYLDAPEKFLRVGQVVRAKFRIFDLPAGTSEDWGDVRAEEGDVGVVVHVEKGFWPTVSFPNGTSTCVTDFEVDPL